MKKATTVLSLVLVSILLMSNVLSAQSGNKNGMNKNRSKQYYQQRAQFQNIPNITDSQKEKLKTLKTKMMKDALPLKNKLEEQKAHLNSLSTAETADMKSINKQIELIGSSKTEMMKLRANFRQEVRKVLTDEQRVYFDSHRRGMNNKGHHRGHHNNMNCSQMRPM